MKQIIQNYKTGEIRLEEVSPPICRSDGVLVRNVASAVSLGTERSIIDLGKKSLIGKAMARPHLFKQALNKAKGEGFWKIFQEAMGRLDAPNPLGYSCAGVADDLLRVRFGMNLPEPDSFVVVACPDTEIGFSWEGGNRLKIGDGFIFTPLEIMPRCSLRARGPLGRRLQRG